MSPVASRRALLAPRVGRGSARRAGPFCRWHTSAFALGTLADGRLVGDLLIVGGGNAQLSSAALAAWFRRLHDQGLADGDVQVENGSGLSHSERAKPRALVQLLRKAWRAEQAQAFFDSLPVAGVDGTLKSRLLGGRAAGQAYLRTGTLNDTRALAGYVHAASGKMYAVALMVDGADAARGRPALDAMVEWLAGNG